jgi:hypothetical protein
MKHFGITEADVRDLTDKEDAEWERVIKKKAIPFGSETWK